jgi:D-alanyl-D-alanine carboxypeptidase/D-alanyl-D-alanine-endopeptidase (penicillin-binding protein 4)
MKFCFLLTAFLGAGNVWAQMASDVFVRNHPAAVGGISDQAFCSQGPDGEVSAHRPRAHQRIASVTKLLSTLVALDALSPEQRWTTRFTLAGTRLHIAGSGDPWFEEEKVFALIDALQKMGVTRLDEVTFDQFVLFDDEGQQSHQPITIAGVQAAFRRYFTATGAFGEQTRTFRTMAANFMREQGADFPLPTRGIPTGTVRYSASNPLISAGGARTFTHTSRPLKDILKAMNIYSKNKVAQNVWVTASLVRPNLETLRKYGVTADEVRLHNGSGLPVLTSNGRLDNTATCLAVLKVLAGLEEVARWRGIELEEVVGVGTDVGSYKDRFLNDLTVKESVIAKTGSLRNTSSLAGWIEGDVPYRFAILHHTSNATAARTAQDRFLSLWMRGENGPARARPYRPLPMYALERDFLDEQHPVANR